jgi:hypothetical protein
VGAQQNFQPSFAATFTYQQELGQAAIAYTGPHLAAGDAQGRSLLLGAPEKVTITSHI